MFVLGDGNRIKFWKDFWCEEGPLRETFPDLYILAESRGVKAFALWDRSRGEGVWKPIFVKPFNDWELEEVHNFMILVNKSRINQEASDIIVWKGDCPDRSKCWQDSPLENDLEQPCAPKGVFFCLGSLVG